jgi:hypothetical protein
VLYIIIILYALFCPTAFGFLIIFFFKHKIPIPKKHILIPISHSFPLCSFPPLPYLFHLSYLFLISLHLFHMCSIVSLLIAHPASSFLSFHPIPVFSLLIPTSESCYHFPFFCTLSPQVLCHTFCYIWILWFFPFFVPFNQFYVPPSSLLLSIFPLLHWLTRFSASINLSPSPSSFSFLSSIRSCTLPFHPFCLQTLPFSFPLSLSAYSSCTLPSLCNLAFLSPLLAPFSDECILTYQK